MKKLRYAIPVLGFLAMTAMFFKLPETPDFFGFFGCKACTSSDPYLPLIGAGYFAAIIAVSLLFPAFPNRDFARAGFSWSLLLAIALTYISYPAWCVACIIGHVCNVLIWGIWIFIPGQRESRSSTWKERLCLTLFVPFAVVASFSSLNLTFKEYQINLPEKIAVVNLQQGDTLPNFTVLTTAGRSFTNTVTTPAKSAVINFISLECSHCKEQMQVLNGAAPQISEAYRIVNVSPKLPSDLGQYAAEIEWVEDMNGRLSELFNIAGYPTLFVIGSDGKIAEIIAGVPDQLHDQLMANLKTHPSKTPH